MKNQGIAAMLLFITFLAGCGGPSFQWEEGLNPERVQTGLYYNIESQDWIEQADFTSLEETTRRIFLDSSPYLLAYHPDAQGWFVRGQGVEIKEMEDGEFLLIRLPKNKKNQEIILLWKEWSDWDQMRLQITLEFYKEEECDPSTTEKVLYHAAEAFLWLGSKGGNRVTPLNCEADLSWVAARLGF